MCKYLDSFANVVSPQDKKSSPNVTLKSFDVISHSVASVRKLKSNRGYFSHGMFYSTGIQNAQIFENSVLEYKRNQILLNLARSIFEEQNNLECLVTKIMKEAKDLLKCERCAVFLVDLECCEAVITERVCSRYHRLTFFPFVLTSFCCRVI